MRLCSIIVTVILFFETFTKIAHCEVTPKNYDFTLDKFQTFWPGTEKGKVEEVYKDGSTYKKEKNQEIRRYQIRHLRYTFPVFVQYKDDIVTDFFASLPSYFIHDVYHQSIINRFGKHTKYINKENSSLYVWELKDKIEIYYNGSCTVTCFPVYYSVRKPSDDKKEKSLIELFRNR